MNCLLGHRSPTSADSSTKLVISLSRSDGIRLMLANKQIVFVVALGVCFVKVLCKYQQEKQEGEKSVARLGSSSSKEFGQ